MGKRGNNEGSVFKDKQGRWRGVVTLYNADGSPKKKYFYGKTKREVTEKVNKMLSDLRSNSYIEPCKITLYSWLCTWLDAYCKNEVRPTTLINYETYVQKHIKPTIGNIRLCDLNVLMLQQFYNDRLKNGNLVTVGGLSPKTLRNMHNMLHKALNQAVFLELIPKNPTEHAVLPKLNKKERRFFTVEEQRELQACLSGERIGMAVLLDLYTGMRQGELLALTWQNVHFDLGGTSYIRVTQALSRIKNESPDGTSKTVLCVGVPKTPHSIRTIPLLPDIAKALAEHKRKQARYYKENGIIPNEFVFTSTSGTLIDPRDFQRDFKLLLKRHNIREINVHGIRHTFATRALESGMSVKALSQILGHANVGFTMDTYVHLTEDFKAEEIAHLQGFLE